ncbi:MAG: ABC transporter ATP-binding protein [Caldilinea sp.]|jgi:branched-chain amino acid transport system ATP-binding protein|nr:ABC transporter ATP-binding protein [Caldilinea sp.]GIK71624.1 MAG: ABC transporter ATP-binding protein [Chloroflexota bacterium]
MLVLDQIHTYYDRIHALKGVSLTVQQGEIVTLIGSNGAGKSTTLRTISGLLNPRMGSITLDGEPIDHLPAHEITRLGISHSPEGRKIFARLTVEENLELGAFARKDKPGIREDMNRVMDLFPRLRERLHQRGGTLSGGEQQMLAIGRALMSRPRILLLDEPSMGLAPLLVEQIFRIIENINEQGTTILLVEQNAHVALSIANRAYVMETGVIVLEGPAAEVLASPQVREAYLGG